METPAILASATASRSAICTDHPETPIQYLPLCAAMAVRGGMDPESALACITIRAAELAGVAHRVGSLAPGKDADLIVITQPPPELAEPGPACGDGRQGGRQQPVNSMFMPVYENFHKNTVDIFESLWYNKTIGGGRPLR
ncbi:MAG: amidohydrolase family protein [Oscillospiraceae bacterium]